MSRQIRDRFEYVEGARWFAQWHRDQPDDDAKMIDLDSVGYCPSCLDPVYLIEATRGWRKKNASVTEHLGKMVGAVVWVVYQDKTGAHPGEILVDDRTSGTNHGWLPEETVWTMLSALRGEHVCVNQEVA